VIGLDKGVFPSGRALAESPEPGRALEEERRLAYVAWTRARHLLVLVYDPAHASPFLREAFDDVELGLLGPERPDGLLNVLATAEARAPPRAAGRCRARRRRASPADRRSSALRQRQPQAQASTRTSLLSLASRQGPEQPVDRIDERLRHRRRQDVAHRILGAVRRPDAQGSRTEIAELAVAQEIRQLCEVVGPAPRSPLSRRG